MALDDTVVTPSLRFAGLSPLEGAALSVAAAGSASELKSLCGTLGAKFGAKGRLAGLIFELARDGVPAAMLATATAEHRRSFDRVTATCSNGSAIPRSESNCSASSHGSRTPDDDADARSRISSDDLGDDADGYSEDDDQFGVMPDSEDT